MLGRVTAFRERIQICEQPHGSHCGDGSELDELVLLIDEPGEKASDPTEFLQRVGKIPERYLEIALLSRAVDLARNLIAEQRVCRTSFRRQHFTDRIAERFQTLGADSG